MAYAAPYHLTRQAVSADTHSIPAFGPNPVGRVLRVALPPTSRILKIVDISGRTVKCYPTGGSPRLYAVDIEAAGLPPGVYLARLETAAGTSEHKFVVTRP